MLDMKKTDMDILDEDVFDILSSAEIMLEELTEKFTTIDFNFDYSGIILLYCKAIEEIERIKCNNLESELIETFQKYLLNSRNTSTHHQIPENYWISRMQNETLIRYQDNNSPRSIFHIRKANKNIDNFLKYRFSGDLFSLNTILFLYYVLSEKINDERFQLFKDIYYLYRSYTFAKHTSILSLEDAKKVRNLVIGNEINSDSLIYKLIHLL